MNMMPEFTPQGFLAGADMTTRLADLLTYGLVGLAEPVLFPAPLPGDGTWWGTDDRCDAPAFHQISPRLRDVVLKIGAPVADRRLLGAMTAIAADREAGNQIVFLPPPEMSDDITTHLTARAGRDVRHRAMILREHRRQRLGVSATCDASAINAAIYAAYVLPVAQAALRHLMPDAPGLWLSATPPADPVTLRGFAPLDPRADDPLSDNIFALAMRTGFHGHTAAVMKPWVRLSPFQFGRQVRRAAAPTEVMHRTALCTPQLCLLSTIAPTGDHHAGSR